MSWDIGERAWGSLPKGFWAVKRSFSQHHFLGGNWEVSQKSYMKNLVTADSPWSGLGCLECKPLGWTLNGPYLWVPALLLPFFGFKKICTNRWPGLEWRFCRRWSIKCHIKRWSIKCHIKRHLTSILGLSGLHSSPHSPLQTCCSRFNFLV